RSTTERPDRQATNTREGRGPPAFSHALTSARVRGDRARRPVHAPRLAGCGRLRRVRRALVRILRRVAPAASGPGAARGRSRQHDLRLVVRLVAPRDPELGEPVRYPLAVRAGRSQPPLYLVGADAGARLRSRDPARGSDRVLQPGRAPAAGVRSLDGLPALPRAHALGLGIARRWLPVRLLELHPGPAAARASQPDRRLPAPADRPGDRPVRP